MNIQTLLDIPEAAPALPAKLDNKSRAAVVRSAWETVEAVWPELAPPPVSYRRDLENPRDWRNLASSLDVLADPSICAALHEMSPGLPAAARNCARIARAAFLDFERERIHGRN